MKSKPIIYTFILLVFCSNLIAQQPNIFIPIEFKKAIDKGTRTLDGTPGPNYFQNYSDYKIKAGFNPRTAKLEGTENIVYHNNSNDTLKYIVVRLYADLFKKGASRQTEIDPEDINNGVDLLKVSINDNNIDVSKLVHYGTNVIIPVSPAMNPKSSLKLDFSWKLNLPNKTQLRMGRYDSSTYFVAYWYPQIAVYDDISGWCNENYTGLQEFYNDFSNFDVEISVPKGNIIWATAVLQNSKELFTDEINNRITKAGNSEKEVQIITENDYKNNIVLKKDSENTWHFKSENITDFAFGVSDHYLWDAASLVVDSTTNRRVLVSSVYKIGSTTYADIPTIGRYSIGRFSNDIVGIPFPYPQMTIFEGASGMEFPMMCNDGPSPDLTSKVFVTSHEIFHTYFPFMVGTNEILYAWIDEGLTTFVPKYVEQEYGNKYAHYYISSYSSRTMGSFNDIPLSVPSTNLSEGTYMMQNYGRAATGFYILNDMLGKELFRKVLQQYIKSWESKHPTPTDLLYTINKVTKKDYSWFWNAWFYEYGYADLAMKDVVINDKSVKLQVIKKGSFPVPIRLTVTFSDGTTEAINQTASIWENNNKWSFKKEFSKTVVKIKLGDKDVPDAFKFDNIYPKGK